MSSKILFLATRELPLERILEIQTAQEMDYEVIMVSNNPKIYESYNFTHNFQAPLIEIDKAVPIILDYLTSNALTISGVIAWQDGEEELAAQLTKDLNLPSCPIEANKKARNKAETRLLLKTLEGNYNPYHEFVNDVDSFKKAFLEIGSNCMLKLAGNSGGRGVASVYLDDNLDEVWDKFITANDSSQGGIYECYRDSIILEEKVVGSEHSISGVIIDGKVIIFAINDKRIDLPTQLQYQNTTPSALSKEMHEKVEKMTIDVMSATGVNWRGFHLDFMVTENGLKILELGARLGGECINSHIIPLASHGHLKPYTEIMNVIQGKSTLTETNYSQKFVRKVASRVIAPPKAGYITAISGFEKLCNSPYTRHFIQLKGIGDLMIPPTDAYEQYKVAYIIVETRLDEDIDAILDEMIQDVIIEIEPKG
jgi:biotin carboxylase